jgi:hypothetical protein
MVRGTGPGSTEIRLSKAVEGDLRILRATSEKGRVSLDLKEIDPGSAYNLLAKAFPEPRASIFSEKIDLETEMGGRRLHQKFYLQVRTRERIEATPSDPIVFSIGDFRRAKEKGNPLVKTVQIRAVLDEPYRFKITGVKAEGADPFFKPSLESVTTGREYRLTVTVDQVRELPAGQRLEGSITVTTDDPELPEIKIRCRATF